MKINGLNPSFENSIEFYSNLKSWTEFNFLSKIHEDLSSYFLIFLQEDFQIFLIFLAIFPGPRLFLCVWKRNKEIQDFFPLPRAH
jgi:hypothetical protein